MANYDLEAFRPKLNNIGQYPYLDVVPAGQTAPRKKVFEALGINEARLEFRRWCHEMNVILLVWKMSPSYELVCMTGTISDRSEPNAEKYLQSDREVYGIRIVRHGVAPP